MGRLRVLHRASTTSIGGVENWIVKTYKYIDKSRFEFEIITRNNNLLEWEPIKQLGIHVNLYKGTEQEDRTSLYEEICKILKRNFDILHMSTSIWAGFAIEEMAMDVGIPKVIVHSRSAGIDNPDEKIRQEWLRRHEYYKEKFSGEKATDFWACSKVAADWMFGPQIPRDRIRIIKNSVELEKFSFNIVKREKIRKQLGIDDKFVIGHIARYSHQKNHMFMLDAFSQVAEKRKDVVLLLVGDGVLKKDIEKKIIESKIEKSVMELGWRNDIGDILQAIDLYVLPSFFEGFPNGMIEAQASGVKCLMSDQITDECIITKNAKSLPLDNQMWIDRINEYLNGYERNNTDDEIIKAGYDITHSIKELESLYLEGLPK